MMKYIIKTLIVGIVVGAFAGGFPFMLFKLNNLLDGAGGLQYLLLPFDAALVLLGLWISNMSNIRRHMALWIALIIGSLLGVFSGLGVLRDMEPIFGRLPGSNVSILFHWSTFVMILRWLLTKGSLIWIGFLARSIVSNSINNQSVTITETPINISGPPTPTTFRDKLT